MEGLAAVEILPDKKDCEELDDVSEDPISKLEDSFICPISQEIIEDPVVAADGFTYERNCIEYWFKHGKLTSPMTGARLFNHSLIPNIILRNIIREKKKNYTKFKKNKKQMKKYNRL